MGRLEAVLRNFNPHSREGSDNRANTGKRMDCDFNPHSREGSDTTMGRLEAVLWDFNPHSREGSDSDRKSTYIGKRYFNPHSREGSDMDNRLLEMKLEISIHTPAKGVTREYESKIRLHLFQSTLPRRE